jgi:hypothetical protein
MGLALLLSAVAIVLNGDLRPAPLSVAGLSLGLAIGTRLSLVFPVVALCAIVCLLAWRQRRSILAFLLPVVALGGFWYVRNLLIVGNPLPALHVEFGPISLPYVDTLYTHGTNTGTIAEYATKAGFWRHSFAPGVHSALGDLWPVIVAAGLAGALVALIRGHRTVRAIGVVALACILVYAFTPGSAAAGGNLLYVNVRYLFPGLAIGLALLPLGAWIRVRWRERLLLAALVATFAVTIASPGSPWVAANTRAALVSGAALLVAVVALAAWRRRPPTRPAAGIVAVAVAGAAVGLAWHEQRIYERSRLRDVAATGNPLADLWRSTEQLPRARIGFVNLQQTYPLYGPTLANRVEPVGRRGHNGSFKKARDCPEFAAALQEARVRYLVIAPPDFPDSDLGGTPQEARWMRGYRGARVVYELKPLRITVYELRGAPGSPCRPAA